MILSIENHASKPVQVKMAKYLEEILGDMLVKEKLSDLDNPSPEQLFHKFILKGKILTNLLPTCGLDGDELKEVEGLNEGQHHANEKTAEELAKLVVYSKATKLKSFSSAKKYSTFDMCSSINSPTAEKYAEKESADFVRHTNFQVRI